MIVRTYGRRSRGLSRTLSDSLDDDVSDSLPLSQETVPSQDIYDFPLTATQESSSLWPSSQEFNDNGYKNQTKTSVKTTATQRIFEFDDSRNDAVRRSKKQKQSQSKKDVGYSSMPWISSTSSLMEAQEFGEMMEHVDEVNFALDGLKKGQPVRIRRASLLSLLSICATAPQRRLLRTHGMAKTIIDAILGLNFDDIPSNLAAVALFYVLTYDGQDDHLLESPCCIRFLIKLLKPITPAAKENKTEKVGFKLLALLKDADVSRDTTQVLDSSSAAIVSKVEEILVSCKEMKPRCGDDRCLRRPELSPKWVALLTLEKACLSKISLEDATGTVRKTGGNFKEKLREFGGLDAVFEVAMECHSVMEGLVEQSFSPLTGDKKDLESLVLLSKCLKIMENAAFLSSDNQSHLLEMKGKLKSHGSRLSFTKLVISVIKILSGLYCKSSCRPTSTEKACGNSKAMGDVDEFALTADCKVDRHDVICISSSDKSSSMEWSFSEKSFNTSQNDPGPSTQWLGHHEPIFQTESASMNDSRLKMRTHSSLGSTCSGKLGSSYDELPVTSNGSGALFERHDGSKDDKGHLLEDCQDPFAFDVEEFVPSKWDLLSGRKKTSQAKSHRKRGPKNREIQVEHQCQFTMSQKQSITEENFQRKSINEEYNHSNATSSSQYAEEEYSSLLSDCLLAAVKVLMNLTNDNPLGCRQIAASEGLETLCTLIACHYPTFCSYLPRRSEMGENSLFVEPHNQKDRPLTDPELDFLVAILGLLVNLVEKDEHNRSRLAEASVSLPNSEGLREGSHMAVIPLLCAIFLANQGEDDATGEVLSWNDEAAMLQEEKEAEKMILEAYAALLLAFLSTESKSTRNAIADSLPKRSLSVLVPVLDRFVAFHFTLNMISPETHKAVSEVIESCRIP
ncbi:Wings apart-like protein 1 [Hibiscus trionum]|uniref:Wings apart-like protein 1 n=1 Tax=Hibiscus trionum TaxID=183268 RepID=A0A9W7H8G0_HIBTR|nr:Wings apart-like protein 1 [Hibiscus trionum]